MNLRSTKHSLVDGTMTTEAKAYCKILKIDHCNVMSVTHHLPNNVGVAIIKYSEMRCESLRF